MRHVLAFHAKDPSVSDGQPSSETMASMQRLMNDFADALHSAGVMIAAEMLGPSIDTVTVTRQTGSTVIEDGPFPAVKESLAGVLIIDVPNRDAALAWAERFPGTSYGTVEVRAVGASYIRGAWQQQ